MTADLVFYTRPLSRGRMVRWLLEEMGVAYEAAYVDTPDAIAAYRAVNPIAKVPAVVHRGRTVVETAAIFLYLAETFPEAGLGPTDDTRADFYRWMLFASGPMEAAMVDHVMGFEVAPQWQPMVGYGTYERMVDALEAGVEGRRWIAGDGFSAADVYLASQIGWGMHVGMLPRRPAFEAYFGPLWNRPAAVRARAIDDALLAAEG